MALLAILLPSVLAPVSTFRADPFPTGGPTYAAADGAMNILLIGSDTRSATLGEIASGAPTNERSDTLMLVHISADRSRVAVVSLMRDLFVAIPGHGTTKLNAAFSYGGVPLTIATVEQLLHVNIDHVAVMDFDGFASMSEAVGGVPVTAPFAFDSRNMPGYHFTAGRNVVSGQRALAFVRERYAFADADFQRVRDQQSFIQGMLEVVLHGNRSIGQLTNLAQTTREFVTVDRGLSTFAMARLAWSLRHIDPATNTYMTAPTLGTGTEDGQSVVFPDTVRMLELGQAIAADNSISASLGGDRAP
ncbi:LCP family protein [Curtobacterium ammoniigenes]|uniref:LCP family protein n=1 Tax=Curtobacterium ammoniigenes TaxID=395387 RepID=UPI0014702B83|nr:LCP family protein [Curtobacterium ammoniigenes]